MGLLYLRGEEMWNEVIEMNRKQFTVCGVLITMALGAIIGWSINIGNPLLPVVALVVGMAILYLCKTRVTEVIEDERIYRIGEKAALRTYQIFVIALVVIGIVLIALRDTYPGFEQIGSILIFCVFALMALYMIFYAYYSRKGLDR